MATCSHCGRQVALPFLCRSCGREFCVEHRLPEAHGCRVGASRAFADSRTQWSGNTSLLGSGLRPRRAGGTSLTEIQHILAAAGIFLLVELSYFSQLIYAPFYLLAIFGGVLAAFLIHEYAHKLAAQGYGYWAEFRLDKMGALLSMISVLSPIKIIAPGAVRVYGTFVAKEDVGRIAAAGPVTNLVQSLVFMLAYALIRQTTVMVTGFLLASLNADLALFNLIPLSVMDGRKIAAWDRRVWSGLFTSTLALWLYVRFFAYAF